MKTMNSNPKCGIYTAPQDQIYTIMSEKSNRFLRSDEDQLLFAMKVAGAKDHQVVHYFDKSGEEHILVAEEFAVVIMPVIAGILMRKGLMSCEEAARYIAKGMEE